MWDASSVYTIGHAARLTGVPSATLRAWERRYGLVAPARTESGYRLYDERALQLLRAMATLVAGGWSPRQAAEHLRSDAADAADVDDAGQAPREVAGGPAADRAAVDGPAVDGAWDVTALARGAAGLDTGDVERAVDAAFAAGSLEQVVDSWLMPALAMLGTQWREGRVDVAGEHVVSAIVQRRLGVEMEAAARTPRGPQAVVGLARGSRHELGILAFSVILRRAGVDVVYLGADLPAQHWVRAVQQRRPAAVVIGVPTANDLLAARETVATLRGANPQEVVHVGGGAQFEVGQGTVPLGHAVAVAAVELADGLRTDRAG